MKINSIQVVMFVGREDYPELLSICDDPNDLPQNYDLFLKRIDEMDLALKESGMALVKVNIKPNEFLEWCRKKNLRVDGRARAEYAALIYSKTK